MKKSNTSSIFLIQLWLLTLFLMGSCDQKLPFSREEGLSAKDSLFLGIHLGMEQKSFFDHCTDLNQQQIITQGPGEATSVEYRMEDVFEDEVVMRFFPTFIDYKIFEMPVTYNYAAWAPWNKQFVADSLLQKILVKYKEWYGDDFQLINHPTQGKVYARIDGKRRINLFVRDDQFVQAVFTDLKVEKRLKEEYRKSLEQ